MWMLWVIAACLLESHVTVAGDSEGDLEGQPVGQKMCRDLCHRIHPHVTESNLSCDVCCNTGPHGERRRVHLQYLEEKLRKLQKREDLKTNKDIMDINKDTKNDCNILYSACASQELTIVKMTLSKIVSSSMKDHDHRMSWSHGFNFVFDKSCSLTRKDKRNNTILHVASEYGFTDVAKCILLHRTININSKGSYGRTPILIAVRQGHMNMFKFLMKAGSSLRGVDKWQSNLLHLACKSGNIEIVKIIVSKAVIQLESRTSFGQTPAMNAAMYGHYELFRWLVGKGINLLLMNRHGQNYLHLASSGGNTELVTFVISRNVAELDSKCFSGETPVMAAAELGFKNVFDVLVKKGCDLSVVDYMGNTILHKACKGGNVGIVKYLMNTRGKAGLETRNANGRTPFQFVDASRHKALYTMLHDKA